MEDDLNFWMRMHPYTYLYLPVCLPVCPTVSVSLWTVNNMVQANYMLILYNPMSYWFGQSVVGAPADQLGWATNFRQYLSLPSGSMSKWWPEWSVTLCQLRSSSESKCLINKKMIVIVTLPKNWNKKQIFLGNALPIFTTICFVS